MASFQRVPGYRLEDRLRRLLMDFALIVFFPHEEVLLKIKGRECMGEARIFVEYGLFLGKKQFRF